MSRPPLIARPTSVPAVAMTAAASSAATSAAALAATSTWLGVCRRRCRGRHAPLSRRDPRSGEPPVALDAAARWSSRRRHPRGQSETERYRRQPARGRRRRRRPHRLPRRRRAARAQARPWTGPSINTRWGPVQVEAVGLQHRPDLRCRRDPVAQVARQLRAHQPAGAADPARQVMKAQSAKHQTASAGPRSPRDAYRSVAASRSSTALRR